MAAAPDSRKADEPRRPLGRRAVLRGAAGLSVLAIAALLVWGALFQQPSYGPFETPNLFAWLWEPEPHRAYRDMPVVPMGSDSGFVARDLCAKPESCSLKPATDGQVRFSDDKGADRTASRLHRSSKDHHLFALTSTGEVFVLARGQAWRELSLPSPEGRSSNLEPIILKHDGQVGSVAFSPDGSKLLTTSTTQLTLWDARTGQELSSFPAGKEPTIDGSFSPDGRRIAEVFDDRVDILDVATGRVLGTLRGHEASVRSASFSPDGRLIVTASFDGTARVYYDDGKAYPVAAVLKGHSGSVNRASFSPDGRSIVTASRDGTARLWEAASGKELRRLSVASEVLDAAFSPDGRSIVTASRDSTARLWAVGAGSELGKIDNPQGPIWRVSFSPAGDLVLGASGRSASIWSAANGALVGTVQGHTGDVLSAVFSPDGSRIATASADTTARLWPSPQANSPMSDQKPVVKAMASSSGGDLWAVGSAGYVAHSSDGQSWVLEGTADPVDLIAVAAVGTGSAMALTANNTLIQLSAGQQQREQQLQQQQQQQKAIVPSKGSGDGAPMRQIPIPDSKGLRTLAFVDQNKGWVVGAGGLIRYTADAGKTWSMLYSESGLALDDIQIEPSGVGWAIGKSADGQQTVIAANKATAGQGSEDGWRKLPYHLGPWYFFFGIPALLLCGLALVRTSRADPAPPPPSIEEVATSDQPLRWGDSDARSLKPLAHGLSRFLRNINTQPPLTLAITGRWGSGKSSLMNLLMADLQQYGGRAVWFNAWHHREEEHLLAALFEAIRREAPPGWWSWPGLVFRARLLWARSKSLLLNLAYCALFAGIALVTVRLALPAFHVEELERIGGEVGKQATGLLGSEAADAWKAILSLTLAGSGSLALLVLWMRGKLTALPANPAKLVSALARRASLGDFSDKLTFRHRFGEQFRDVCNALLTRTSPGLVILIDDLDRCPPEDVLKILEAVNYLVSAGPCTIVLGMDRRQIEYCVGLGFEKLVEGLPEEELIYGAEETSDKSGKQRAFARHYLEKLINIEVPVPALDDDATEALLLRGTPSAELGKEESPKWLQTTKRVGRTVFQIARVGLLAFAVGILLTWGAERLRHPSPSAPPPTNPTAGLELKGFSDSPSSPVANAAANAQRKLQQETSVVPATVDVAAVPPTLEVPDSRRWLWWAPTVLLIGVALLFGGALAVHRQQQIVRDSPKFAKALRAVKPLLATINATPRAIKRYQNRMRYLAARLRPAVYEPDWIDSLVHWLGLRFGRQWVPAAWFEERSAPAIAEPALILLGAIEQFAPRAFASPRDLVAQLQQGTPGDKPTEQQVEAWAKVRNAFAEQELVLPTGPEVARYATFVLSKERKTTGHLAEVVPLSRDSTERR